MKKLVGFLIGLFMLGASLEAQVGMLQGPVIAVNNATNASPIVVTTASSHGLSAGDYVTIANVGGNTAASDGGGGQTSAVRKCSAVTGTTCTLQKWDGTSWVDTTGNGAYTSGGTFQAHGVVANTTGRWFDVGPCAKVSFFAHTTPGAAVANATLNLNFTSSVGTDPLVFRFPTPISTLKSITSLDNGQVGNGAYSPSISARFVRAEVTSWVAGTVYATLNCTKFNGGQLW